MNNTTLTRKEACAFIGCGRTKLYQLERNGELEGTYYEVGRKRYYYTSSLEQWKRNGGTLDRSDNNDGNTYNHIQP